MVKVQFKFSLCKILNENHKKVLTGVPQGLSLMPTDVSMNIKA